MRKLGVIGMLALSLAFSGCVAKTFKYFAKHQAAQYAGEHGPIEDYGARCDREVLDIPYASGLPGSELLTLDVYYNEHEGLQPMIVNIHGGGWFAGDKAITNQVFRSKYLANRGYVVFNVNYRLAPEHKIQTQIEDVMGAVIWAKEHAAQYGGDPARVGVTGGSAGGHLAVMAAWASDDPFFAPTGHEDSTYDSGVLAAAPFYGVYDLEATLPRIRFGIGMKGFTGLRRGPELDELMHHISPQYHVTSDAAPTLFLCGDKDTLYEQTVEFERRLREARVETALFTAPGGPHGFEAPYADEISQQAAKAMVEWFDRFLK